jgi:cellulose synthase operon protein C
MTSTAKTGGTEPAKQAQDSAHVLATIARLRAEQSAQTENASPAREAALLHEVGVLEEAIGDEAAAARDQLASVNAEPEFTEPLERLIAIIERRQSYKNLGKLLERLSQVALTSNERARALIERAFFLADHQDDLVGAKALAEEAAEAAPDDPTNYLVLELLAAKAGDAELRQRALSRRATLAQSPVYKALLFLDLAELRVAAGDADGAKNALGEALATESPAKFLALHRAERLYRELGEPKLEAAVLEQQAGLVLAAIADPSVGDGAGVPSGRRAPAHAADAWLRAAEAHGRAGDGAQATVLLDRALEQLPGDPSLTHARLTAAEEASDSAGMAALAKNELESGAKGELAAALWLRIAEAAAAESNAEKALEAVRRALAEDPQSIPARALELDLLGGAGDGAALASALESVAERVTTDRARAGFYLVAADTWARIARDAGGARAALSQAAACGAVPAHVARVGRLLAASIEDQAWYEESTRRVISQGALAEEQASLWFEIGRARALRGERSGATQAFEAIAAAPGGSWLGHWLASYALDVLPQSALATEPPPAQTPKKPWETLVALSREEPVVSIARAARLVAAVRALSRSDGAAALELLDALAKDDDTDPVVAVALSLLRAREGKHDQAASALLACAAGVEDQKLATALRLEAGLVLWRAGLRTQGVDAFERASESSSAAAGLLAWALRAAHPDDLSARRRALENADRADEAAVELERFTLELSSGPVTEKATEAARAALSGGVDSTTGPGLAKSLARALFSATTAEDRSLALDALAEQSPAAAALARGAAFELELAQAGSGSSDPGALEAAAARWTEADPRAAPALEWLAAAVKHGDIAAEVSARRALAERIGGNAGAVVGANASLVAWLTGLEEPPPLASNHVSAALVNVELAPPGSDPRRRAQALTNAATALGEESLTVTRALAGYNQLAAQDPESALGTFRGVVEAAPGELIGWEGLRAAAETLGRKDTLAEASAALGDAVHDPVRGAELWEQAATILLDELGDKQRGEFALSRAVERDVRRFAPFDRLFRIVRERKDHPRLLDLIARRLEVADDSEEIVKLFWERARVLRSSGDREGALAALESVRMLEPEHVGALALSGEIYLTVQRFAEAAEQLGRLSALSAAPTQQRLMSGIAAVDIYEGKLGDPKQALAVLVGLHEAGLGTLPVRERLARAAAKSGAWQRAASTFELVMNERDTSAGRAEAARLAMAIRRDRLSDEKSARNAVAKLLLESPGDGEGLDLVLSDVYEPAFSRPLLERGRDALQRALAAEPFDADGVERLSRIASGLNDARLRQASLGALAALGVEADDLDAELAQLDRRVARVPSIAIDEASLPELADPEDGGPIAALMRVLGTTIALAIGPNLAALGVTKKDRIDPRSGVPVRNEVVAWAGSLGITEIDVYVGGRNPRGVYGVATEPPSLVVGPGITAPLSPVARQAVARELFALQRGTTVLGHREPTDVAALVVAACKLAGVEIDVTPFAMLAEFQRQLGKELPRRVRKLLPELAAAIAHSRSDPLRWYRAATSSLDRMAAVAAGDVSWVLAGDAANRGRTAASVEGNERARRLLSFVLSPSYLALREKLGMGVR